MPLSESDQMLFARAAIHPGVALAQGASATTEGPRPQLRLPRSESLLVGSCTTGPAPQIKLPGLAGRQEGGEALYHRCRWSGRHPGAAARSPARLCG